SSGWAVAQYRRLRDVPRSRVKRFLVLSATSYKLSRLVYLALLRGNNNRHHRTAIVCDGRVDKGRSFSSFFFAARHSARHFAICVYQVRGHLEPGFLEAFLVELHNPVNRILRSKLIAAYVTILPHRRIVPLNLSARVCGEPTGQSFGGRAAPELCCSFLGLYLKRAGSFVALPFDAHLVLAVFLEDDLSAPSLVKIYRHGLAGLLVFNRDELFCFVDRDQLDVRVHCDHHFRRCKRRLFLHQLRIDPGFLCLVPNKVASGDDRYDAKNEKRPAADEHPGPHACFFLLRRRRKLLLRRHPDRSSWRYV